MPRTLRARLRRWAMWRPTNSEPRPTRSRPRGRQRMKTTAWRPAVWSASGSAPNFPTRSENLCSTTSGCATSCAGLYSTADTAHPGALQKVASAIEPQVVLRLGLPSTLDDVLHAGDLCDLRGFRPCEGLRNTRRSRRDPAHRHALDERDLKV